MTALKICEIMRVNHANRDVSQLACRYSVEIVWITPNNAEKRLTQYNTSFQFSREDSTMSLERLLNLTTSDEKMTALETKLQKQLQTALRKIQHLTEVLRESEASSVRLSDQTKLLKEEIRRYVCTCVSGGSFVINVLSFIFTMVCLSVCVCVCVCVCVYDFQT